MSDPVKTVTASKIVAQVQYIECPSCNTHLEGFVGDPRGAGDDDDYVECEHCGAQISIPQDIVVELQ